MCMCQLGMHNNVQAHRNASVCEQTYDASCTLLAAWHGKHWLTLHVPDF